MHSINLRIDQLKGKEIGIICTDRNDLDYMISLLGYDAKTFASITSFPMALSAKSDKYIVSLTNNIYIFVSTMAVKFANTTQAKPKQVELTLAEIASKLNIPLDQLRIKE